ncbi:MAG: hypothetical protein ABSD20_18080 [Terriglobales bacterium]
MQFGVAGYAQRMGGTTRDASREAAFIETTDSCPVSTTIKLSFPIAGDDPFAPDLGLQLHGSVLRVALDGNGRAIGLVVLFHGEETDHSGRPFDR